MAPSRVLELHDLEIVYQAARGSVDAIRGVSFGVHADEVFGLIGESGSGKSTLAMAILGNLPCGAVTRGRILFDGQDLRAASPATWRGVRWKQLAFVPQAAMSALNPVRRLGDQFEDIIADHTADASADGWRGKIIELLAAVHLPSNVLDRYPHELSGGMKQRVCIAMAVLLDPRLIIADEPTSALDVVSQRLVLQKLLEARARLHAAIMLIGHDLAIQAQVADRIGIMLAGRLVEIGPVTAIFDHPLHAYTKRLIAAVPSIRSPRGLSDSAAPDETERASWLSDGTPLVEVEPGHFVAPPAQPEGHS
jgi:peptide/nickel transport system ATP-binding protein